MAALTTELHGADAPMDKPRPDGDPSTSLRLGQLDLASAFARAFGQPPDAAPGSIAGTAVAIAGLPAWRPWLDEAIGLLDDAENERVSRRRRASDRDALTLSYALHRLYLAAMLGLEPHAVPLSRDALGCPQLGAGLGRTSLSHTDDLVAFAYSARGPVGVDIEPSTRAAMLPDIADRVATPEELSALDGLSEATRAAALLALWVRKEALLKAAGIGMAREMHTIACPEAQPLALPTVEAGLVEVRRLDTGGPCEAAVAVSPGSFVHFKWLHPGGEGSGAS